VKLRANGAGHSLQRELRSRLAVRPGASEDCRLDDPIGLLKDCHRRADRFLHVLWVIADRAAGRQLTREEIESVLSALQYFRLNGPWHSADERDSLFPRLRAESITGNSEELCLLEGNIRRTSRLHAAVDALYSSWILAGRLRVEDELRLQSCAEKLKNLFDEHMRVTEQIVFPRAVQLLDSKSIAAICEEFRARRR
jgi:hemerythrin-like domain-containing protein